MQFEKCVSGVNETMVFEPWLEPGEPGEPAELVDSSGSGEPGR